MRNRNLNRFMKGGYKRARTAHESRIRNEVEREFAAEIKKASWWRRFLIRRRMKREIEERLYRVAPPNALY